MRETRERPERKGLAGGADGEELQGVGQEGELVPARRFIEVGLEATQEGAVLQEREILLRSPIAPVSSRTAADLRIARQEAGEPPEVVLGEQRAELDDPEARVERAKLPEIGNWTWRRQG